MASLRHERRIAASADTVWNVACRPESIPTWFPGIVSCTAPSVVDAPESLVSLAATFLDIVGEPAPTWVEGAVLPVVDEDVTWRSFDATVTEWDSSIFGVDVHVRTVIADGYLYTEYQPGTVHDGSEGEIYDLADDPLRRVNRFDDPAMVSIRAALAERLLAHEGRPGERATPGVLMAPV